jgi:hypothetical protein
MRALEMSSPLRRVSPRASVDGAMSPSFAKPVSVPSPCTRFALLIFCSARQDYDNALLVFAKSRIPDTLSQLFLLLFLGQPSSDSRSNA